MSGLITCYGKSADKPYFLETIGKNIYTIEELCFYYWHYAHLLEESQVNSDLIEWIRGELALEDLAGQLEQMFDAQADLEKMIAAVFRKVHYMPEEEIEQYFQRLKKMKELSPFERSKHKADDLVKNKKYYKAIQEYRLLLKEEGTEKEAASSEIYHNMGVAYSKMFLFQKGSECFLKAFLAAPNMESLRQYKLAVRLSGEVLEEDELVKEFPNSAAMDMQVYEEIQQVRNKESGKVKALNELRGLKNDGKVAGYYEKMNEILHDWQEECRGYMNIL